MQFLTGNLCQFTTSVSDRGLIFYYYKQQKKKYKQTRKAIEIEKKRHKKNNYEYICVGKEFKVSDTHCDEK